MAKRGYFPPQGSRGRQATQPQKPLRKKADPYVLDQNRDNPDVTDYDRSDQALEHEMPDTRTEWRKDERSPVGLPSPSPQMVGNAQPRLNPKEAKRIQAHASFALRVAKAIVPPAAYKRLSVAGREDLLLRMAGDLMGLGGPQLQRIHARLDKLQSFASSFQKAEAVASKAKQAMDPMGPEAPMGDESAELMPEGLDDDLGGDLDEGLDEGMGEGLEPEVMEYIDEAVEEAVEEALGEDVGGDDEAAEFAPMDEGADMFSSLEMPSDEELLGLLDEHTASSRYARDPGHWEDSVKDVEKPADDYHSQGADYYEDESNSADFERQMDLSNPVVDKGAGRRGPRALEADGGESHSDPGSDIDPWSEEDGMEWSGEDHRSNPSWPMGDKFRDQMELSNPVASAADDILTQMAMAGVYKERIPVDASGQIDASIIGTSKSEDGPTILAEFVQGRRDIDAANTMHDAGAPRARVASRQPRRKAAPQRQAQGQPRRQPRQAGVGKGQKRVASQQRQPQRKQAPQKAGVRSVAHLGRRQASASPEREIDALSSLWRSAPDVSKVFG